MAALAAPKAATTRPGEASRTTGVRVTRSRCGSRCDGAGAQVVQPGASKAALPGKTERRCPSGPMPTRIASKAGLPRVHDQLGSQRRLEAGRRPGGTLAGGQRRADRPRVDVPRVERRGGKAALRVPRQEHPVDCPQVAPGVAARHEAVVADPQVEDVPGHPRPERLGQHGPVDRVRRGPTGRGEVGPPAAACTGRQGIHQGRGDRGGRGRPVRPHDDDRLARVLHHASAGTSATGRESRAARARVASATGSRPPASIAAVRRCPRP